MSLDFPLLRCEDFRNVLILNDDERFTKGRREQENASTLRFHDVSSSHSKLLDERERALDNFQECFLEKRCSGQKYHIRKIK